MVKHLSISILVPLFLLGACAVGPDYTRPELNLPAEFSADSWARNQPGRHLDQWWRIFEDPVLDRLIVQARKQNLELKGAMARLAVARALRAETAADLRPAIGAGGSYTWRRLSETGVITDIIPGGTAGPPTASVAGPGFKRDIELWQAGFDASWELDLFGRVERMKQARDAEIDAKEAELGDALVSLLGEITREYIHLRRDQAQLDISRRSNGSRAKTLRLTRQLESAGLGTMLDVSRAGAQLSAARAEIPRLEAAIQVRTHRLAVLLGEAPDALADELDGSGKVPYPGDEKLDLLLPAELLRRRPDLRRAERLLAAEVARIGAAEADLYPRFSISGTLGWSATEVTDVNAGRSLLASIGPSISWPIFEGGALRARIAAADARALQAHAIYRQTALLALEEVENALAVYGSGLRRGLAIEDQVRRQRRSLALARQRYRNGLGSFIEVLDADRQLLAARSQLVGNRADTSTSLVALYKALGGGWSP